MIGYKIFHKIGNIWNGPFRCPEDDWVIEEGSIIQANDFDPRPQVACGPGIHFYQTLERAKDEAKYDAGWGGITAYVFQVEVIDDTDEDDDEPAAVVPITWPASKPRTPKQWAKQYKNGIPPSPADKSIRYDKARARKVKLVKVVYKSQKARRRYI
jgi:hypothetical protein